MHPTLRIIALILLAVTGQFLPPWALLAVGLLLSAAAFLLYPGLFARTLRRSRWLLLAMLLIYAFSTPGEYLAYWPFEFAPTHEGLMQGALQAGRLTVMLAALAILLGATKRDALVAGIFQLIAPLRWVGLNTERFSARLWLTLHYVEEAPRQMHGGPWARMEQLALAGEAGQQLERIRFMSPPFGLADWLALLLMVGLMAGWALL